MEILQRCRSSVVLIGVFLCTACIITSEGNSRLPVIYVMEGAPFELTCQLTFFEWPKWQRDGRDLPAEMSGDYVTETNKTESGLVSRLYVRHAHRLHTAKYRCTAFRNDSQQVVVRVSGLKDDGHTIIMSYHHKLELTCNLTGSTEADLTYKWTKDGLPLRENDKHELSGKKLIIPKAGEDDAGKYVCEATNSKSNATASKLEINVLAKPYVKMPRELAVVEGTTLRLECHAIGYPKPEIKWFVGNGTELDAQTDRLKFESYKNISNAIIIIKDAVREDRSTYNCTAHNDLGLSSGVTHVRIKDKLAALWPFLGICAEVVVLCTIILIYEKKRNKTELDESDTDQSPEQKNTPDHGKDVRQRK